MSQTAWPELDIFIEEVLDQSKLWAVILWNDDVNTAQHVAETLMAVLKCDAKRAIKFTVRAHNDGRTMIALRPKDEAKLIVEQLLAEKIQASMEQS